MKPVITENKKDSLKIEFKDLDQGFMTLVKDKLWEDKATNLAGFRVTHPETGVLQFTLKTKGKEAKKVWNDALTKLNKDMKDFDTEIKKLK
jgi:DNA-directed RNA polymerase subunit L